jgi:hypothetical protein
MVHCADNTPNESSTLDASAVLGSAPSAARSSSMIERKRRNGLLSEMYVVLRRQPIALEKCYLPGVRPSREYGQRSGNSPPPPRCVWWRRVSRTSVIVSGGAAVWQVALLQAVTVIGRVQIDIVRLPPLLRILHDLLALVRM